MVPMLMEHRLQVLQVLRDIRRSNDNVVKVDNEMFQQILFEDMCHEPLEG